MKCRYIRDDQEVSPAYYDQLEEFVAQGLVEYRDIMRDGAIRPIPFFKMGAVYEGPQVHLLVRLGVAIPADEACAARVRMTPAQLKSMQRMQELMARFIELEDGDLFDAGVITGVDRETGNYIPGPNFHRLAEFRPVETAAEGDEEDEV